MSPNSGTALNLLTPTPPPQTKVKQSSGESDTKEDIVEQVKEEAEVKSKEDDDDESKNETNCVEDLSANVKHFSSSKKDSNNNANYSNYHGNRNYHSNYRGQSRGHGYHNNHRYQTPNQQLTVQTPNSHSYHSSSFMAPMLGAAQHHQQYAGNPSFQQYYYAMAMAAGRRLFLKIHLIIWGSFFLFM